MWEGPGGSMLYVLQTRQEAEIRLRRRGIWSPISVTPDHGRAVTLALLCKAATRNAVRAHNPIPHQRRGRGRGLSSLLHDHPSNPSLEPITVGTIGMGRARSRDSGPHPFHEPPLQVPNMWPQYLKPTWEYSQPSSGPNPYFQKCPLDPHHWSS